MPSKITCVSHNSEKYRSFLNKVHCSDIPVTETETNTEMIVFSKTYAETKTIVILNTDTI